jgi:hypothetical protein
MSYCHLIAPGWYSNTKMFFGVAGESSQAVTTLMRTYIEGNASCFGTVAGLTVSGISPPSGSTAGGTPVTISGTGFTAPATVKIRGVAATSVVVVNGTTITAVTPAGTAGLADASVVIGSQGATLVGAYTYTTGPSVSAIAPNSGSTLGGAAVTVTGANFVNGATVSIGGVAATGVSFVNATTLMATTGAHATGTVSVVVRNPDAQTGTLANAYFYAPPPSITRFYTLTPCRVVDTRGGTPPIGGPVLAASEQRVLTLAGFCGIPTNAVAISVNVAVVPAAAGYMTLFPGNGVNPGSSTINFGAGQVRGNNAILRLATDGSGTVAVLNGSSGANHFILDVNGYFR